MNAENLEIIKTYQPKVKENPENIPFGTVFTDHMFKMEYAPVKGWHDPKIVPYQPITLDPASTIFHYGQTVFEGLKAYRTEDDRILLFRPSLNFQRLNRSSERLSIPAIDEELVLYYLAELLKLEHDWVPCEQGTSLYIRPFIIATERSLSVAPSRTYTFMIILSPVGSYYPEGVHPIGIQVEDNYTRAVRGGTGTAKTAGNYSAAYIAQEKATVHGHSQVLWLDGVEKKYIEEVGSMNVFFKISGNIVTPALNGSILDGITRASIIELLNSWDIPVEERQISMEEVYQAYENGELEEAFGTGTAAVISPIGVMQWQHRTIEINDRQTGDLSKRLYDTLTGIQTGKNQDEFNWTLEID